MVKAKVLCCEAHYGAMVTRYGVFMQVYGVFMLVYGVFTPRCDVFMQGFGGLIAMKQGGGASRRYLFAIPPERMLSIPQMIRKERRLLPAIFSRRSIGAKKEKVSSR